MPSDVCTLILAAASVASPALLAHSRHAAACGATITAPVEAVDAAKRTVTLDLKKRGTAKRER